MCLGIAGAWDSRCNVTCNVRVFFILILCILGVRIKNRGDRMFGRSDVRMFGRSDTFGTTHNPQGGYVSVPAFGKWRKMRWCIKNINSERAVFNNPLIRTRKVRSIKNKHTGLEMGRGGGWGREAARRPWILEGSSWQGGWWKGGEDWPIPPARELDWKGLKYTLSVIGIYYSYYISIHMVL